MRRRLAEPRKPAALHFEREKTVQSMKNRRLRASQVAELRQNDHRIERRRSLLETAVGFVDQHAGRFFQHRGEAVEVANHCEAVVFQAVWRN